MIKGKYDKIVPGDTEGSIDGIIRFDTSGRPEFSWWQEQASRPNGLRSNRTLLVRTGYISCVVEITL